MSLYRSVRRKGWKVPAALSAICLVVGFLIGFLMGSEREENTVSDAVAALQEEIKPAFNALELTVIEYKDSVKNGRVIAATEYKAAQQDIEKLEDAIGKTKPDLAALDPEGTKSIEKEVSRLKKLVSEKADAVEVEGAADSLKRKLRDVAGVD